MKTPIDVKSDKPKETIVVEHDKKVEVVEKYFKQLDFKHQVRLATECLTKKCIEQGFDARIKTQGMFEGNQYNFTITISLDEK